MNKQTERYCQSCGMPLERPADLGTEQCGAASEDYCVYCYKEGVFTQDCTMEEMIELCLECEKDSGFYEDRDAARKAMLEWFPTLRRWRKT